MKMLQSIILYSMTFISSISATAIPYQPRIPSKVRTIYEFPNGTFVENIAVRANGQILLTTITQSQLFLLDPQIGAPPVIVHTFPSLGLNGIVEYAVDVFACISGNFSVETGDPGKGSYTIWSVDLRGVEIQPDKTLSPEPRVSEIINIPDAELLNGLTVLSAKDRTLLVSDSHAGNIRRVEAESGKFEVVIDNTFTEAVPFPPFPVVGVNGLHVRDGTLYFTNTGKGTFNRVPIAEDGTPTGPFATVAHTLTNPVNWDDFTFDYDGNSFLVTGVGNTVNMISSDGSRQVVIAGDLNSTAIAEPTSVAFGRGLLDKNILYVTTGGGLLGPVNGDIIIGGQLVAVTTSTKGLY